MGAAGSTHGSFQRAVERGNVLLALTLARELGTLSLDHALSLTAMFARAGDERFQRAAVRWLGRLASERDVSLQTLAAATRLVRALPDVGAERMLRALLR